MGVDRTDYVMVACNMGAKAFDWNRHEAEMEGRPDRRFDIVYDGMNGAYCMAGKIIASCDSYQEFEIKRLDAADLAVDRPDLAAKVSAAFDVPVSPDEFALVLFTHYS